MRRFMLAWPFVAVALALSGGLAHGDALVRVSGNFGSTPMFTTAPPDDPRLFVVERDGGIRVVENGVVQPTPFLTVPGVDTDGERGMSSIAFAPDYATSGLFYVFVTPANTDGDLEVLEYRRSASDPDVADPASARLVLLQHHPSIHHYGGQLAFGPDGYLYITVGDGQQTVSAQDTSTLLGKVLRIDPRVRPDGAPYGIPDDNPFASNPRCGPNAGAVACPEMYAYGFRNPFRASFDTANGNLLVADVGETTWEEVDLVRPGGDYGWGLCEGNHNTGTESAGCSDLPSQTPPVFEYHHDDADCAIIGGYVVRDPTLPDLSGRYLYGDYCGSELSQVDLSVPGSVAEPTGLRVGSPTDLVSFGTDAGGCVYVLAGTVYRVAATSQDDFACPTFSTPPPNASGPGAVAPTASTGATNPMATSTSSPPRAGDVTPPSLRVKFRKAQRLRTKHQVGIGVACDEECNLSATGSVSPGNHAGLRGARKHALAGQNVTLSLKLSRAAATHLARVLENGRRVTAHIQLTARDTSGNTSHRSVRLRLR